MYVGERMYVHVWLFIYRTTSCVHATCQEWDVMKDILFVEACVQNRCGRRLPCGASEGKSVWKNIRLKL